jgi:hypothetical protein
MAEKPSDTRARVHDGDFRAGVTELALAPKLYREENLSLHEGSGMAGEKNPVSS